MSAYLKFFELEQSPFEGKAQSKVVLGTKALREAFAAIRDGLDEGSARICVNGGPGLGKTSLARSLPKLLGDTARVAVVLDPSVSWDSLRGSIAKQWGLESGGLARARLLEAARETRLVMVVDRAEQATEEFLDHLDILLSVRSETDEPAVQSVLLACLAGGEKKAPAPLLWWLDRIQTLQLEFAPIPREGVESYIHKHLKRAGWRGERLFSAEAALAIHGVTGGIPGEISTLCERLLAEAAESDLHKIDEAFVRAAIEEPTEDDGQEAGDSTLEDEFEELALEEEFKGASPDAAETQDDQAENPVDGVEGEPTAPSLSQTLEHFENGAAEPPGVTPKEATEADESPLEIAANPVETPAGADALDELEEYLAAPASFEEIQAIRRGRWVRQLRTAAAVAAAVLICGSVVAWLFGESESGPPPQRTHAQPLPSPILKTENLSATGPDGKVLARLRGPVTAIDLSPGPSFESIGSESNSAQIMPREIPGPNPSGDLKSDEVAEADSADSGDNENSDEKFAPEDFVDMRPASLRPDATSDPDAEAHFW